MVIKVNIEDDFDELIRLLNLSFATVAKDFGLTRENCPTNNAFINQKTLKNQFINNREFYKYNLGDKPVGFITIERSNNKDNLFYIENLAVHPGHRHRHIGQQLMEFATNRIKELGGKEISIGLIDSNIILKKWYEKLGYYQTGTKVYAHLPFKVCFMVKKL